MAAQKTYLYKDRFTGDEMFSGVYPSKVVDDVAFEVQAKFIIKSADGEVDIGCGSAFGGDGGGAAGGAGYGGDAGAERVLDVVEGHGLVETSFKKKDLMEYFKAYMARVRQALKDAGRPERVRPFMEGMKVFLPKIVDHMKEFDFYVNESMDYEAGIAMLFYKEDGVTPALYFIRDGLVLGFPGNGKSLESAALVPAETAEREGFVMP